ncbi:rhodanese-like domain-containing protein [Anaeromyxobacter paludicola]|uniref:Rhodanese domain-containing protein n=1 Tax=Anaeromyxobacter paludicola TaxID=2918171 RepID=A0ABN6N2Z3_9BACT|nr:hypothetical protein [Anaeromyxobacter paludicola]BDG06895.1 hypothetical protein AMPC_00080 [Anaeromyxobacter paludicola]
MALRLRELGWEDAYALKGGYDAWKQAGMPVEPRGAGAQSSMTPP